MPGKRLLLVEDHSAFAQAMELVLVRSRTFDAVAMARTLSEGRELALANGYPFGMTVVDLVLPDGDGTELVREIKARRPEAPVLVLSAREDLFAAREAGADAVLNKAEPMARIVMAIEGLLAR